LAPKTSSKYFQNFRAFLNWCVEEEYLVSMPGAKLKLAGLSKAEAQEARYPFSPEQLQTLFQSPQFTGHKSAARRSEPGDMMLRDGKFWIPLIALFSGLRLGEIVQLLATDIKEYEGITYFAIERNEGEDKQLKTASSRRDVPIHPALIQLGLLRHIQAQRTANPKGRIFSDIEPGSDGYFSHNFSKWFSRYANTVGAKTRKTSFHSFRHNFKDAMVLAGIEESRRRALMGHAEDDVHGTYGSKLPIPVLFDTIKLVKYNFEAIEALTNSTINV
jgi:integrase